MKKRSRDPLVVVGGIEPVAPEPAPPQPEPVITKKATTRKKKVDVPVKRERLQTNVSSRAFVLLHVAMLNKRKLGQRGRQVDIATCIEEALEATYGRFAPIEEDTHATRQEEGPA